MEATFRECVEEERRAGRTILLSSHILAEAEALSDRVSIIRDGRCVETGTLAELRHLTRTAIDAELAAPVSLDGLPGVHDLDVVGLRLRCQVDNDTLTDVLRRLAEAGVRTMTCQPPTLDGPLSPSLFSRTGCGLRAFQMTGLTGTGLPSSARALPPGPDPCCPPRCLSVDARRSSPGTALQLPDVYPPASAVHSFRSPAAPPRVPVPVRQAIRHLGPGADCLAVPAGRASILASLVAIFLVSAHPGRRGVPTCAADRRGVVVQHASLTVHSVVAGPCSVLPAVLITAALTVLVPSSATGSTALVLDHRRDQSAFACIAAVRRSVSHRRPYGPAYRGHRSRVPLTCCWRSRTLPERGSRLPIMAIPAGVDRVHPALRRRHR